MWQLRKWFCSEFGSVKLMAGLSDLSSLFQPKWFYDSTTDPLNLVASANLTIGYPKKLIKVLTTLPTDICVSRPHLVLWFLLPIYQIACLSVHTPEADIHFLFFVIYEVPLPHITQKHLLSTLDLHFLTCPPNSWFRRILLPCWPDCWQGCWQRCLLLTRMFLPHFLRWILSLYPGVLSAQDEAHSHKSQIPVVDTSSWTRCYPARLICSYLSFSLVPAGMKREHLGPQVLQSQSSEVILGVLQPFPSREI